MGLEAGRSGMLGGTRSGQNRVSGAWLALRLALMRLVLLRRAEVLRCTICDHFKVKISEAGPELRPVGAGGPYVWVGVMPSSAGL